MNRLILAISASLIMAAFVAWNGGPGWAIMGFGFLAYLIVSVGYDEPLGR